MIARAKGFQCHLTIPENISADKKELLCLLGATVTECPCVPFADPRSYMSRAHAIAQSTEGAVMPDQFENVANSNAHFRTTGPELWRQSGQALDGFVCAAGTGGTIAGVSRYLKSVHRACSIFLIDPTGSGLKSFVETGVFASSGTCFIDGIGIGRKTANFATAVVDGAFRGDDREAIEMAYYLLRHEGLFVGPSAALNVVGAVKLARKLGPGCRVATVLCDGGERYRATTFNAEWLESKGLAPKWAGASLGFVHDDAAHAFEVSREAWAWLAGEVVRALPQEWRGTTFKNAHLLGREGFARGLLDLLTQRAGLTVAHVFTFPSALNMALAAVVLAADLSTTTRIYTGERAPPLTPAQQRTLAHVGGPLEFTKGLPPPERPEDDTSIVLCLASALPAWLPGTATRAPPRGVDGIVGDHALIILNDARIRPSDVLTLRKRLATPMTTPVAIQRLEKLAAGAAHVTPAAAAAPCRLDPLELPPSPSELASFHSHLQTMSGTPVDCHSAPACFTAGLSALAALWMALIARGGADVLMSSTAYGGSSQVTDILATRAPAQLRKHTFDVSGGTDILESVREALVRLREAAKPAPKAGFFSAKGSVTPSAVTTVLFVEAPTNPDMKVPDLPALATMLAKHAAAAGTRALLLVDTTLAPMSKVIAKAASASPELPVMVLLSMSKSVSRGLTTAGALIANHTSSELLAGAGDVGTLLETTATVDQMRRLVDNHTGTEERCAGAYRTAMAVGAHLVAAVRAKCGVTMALSTVSAEAAREGYASTTISFNLPPPAGASKKCTAELAQAFVDALCADAVHFKPCVSFGQDNGLVYCTVPATSTQGAIKAEDKAKQEVGGVQLVRLSFPPSLDERCACSAVSRAVDACYDTAAGA